MPEEAIDGAVPPQQTGQVQEITPPPIPAPAAAALPVQVSNGAVAGATTAGIRTDSEGIHFGEKPLDVSKEFEDPEKLTQVKVPGKLGKMTAHATAGFLVGNFCLYVPKLLHGIAGFDISDIRENIEKGVLPDGFDRDCALINDQQLQALQYTPQEKEEMVNVLTPVIQARGLEAKPEAAAAMTFGFALAEKAFVCLDQRKQNKKTLTSMIDRYASQIASHITGPQRN